MIHQTNGSVYSEVDAFSTLLNYKTANAGCCKVSICTRIIFAAAELQKNAFLCWSW